MKKIIRYYIILLLIDTYLSAMVSKISFTGYPEESFAMFKNPASVGYLERFNLSTGYGWFLPGVLSEKLYTTVMSLSGCYNKIFFGAGIEQIVLENIYSENMYVANLGTKILDNKLSLGTNFRYLNSLFSYDEYYMNDRLANENVSSYNLDFGLMCNPFENFYIGISGQNLLESKIGTQIKYVMPKKYIFSFGYLYGVTVINCDVIFQHQFVEDKIVQSHMTLRFGLNQELFYSKLLSSDVTIGVEKSSDFTELSLSLQAKLVSNRLRLKYHWFYPLTDIKKFTGNHYVMLSYSPAKVVKKKIIKREPEIIEKIVVVEEKKKPVKKKVETPEYEIQQPPLVQPVAEKVEQQKITEEKPVVVSTTAVETTVQQIQKEAVQPTPVVGKEYKVVYKFPLAHKVKEGETLMSIAKKYYNDEKLWKKIYNANKDKIIKGIPIVGEILVIPEP